MKREKIKFESLEAQFKVIEQDLRSEYPVDDVPNRILGCLSKKVSPELMALLSEVLLGFSDDMQLELADDLLDFAYGHVMHTTGCLSADAILKSCYEWIAEEQGITIKN